MIEPKACPWCGFAPSTSSITADCWQTYCENIECVAEVSVLGLTGEKSIRAWNDRSEGRKARPV